MWKLSKRRRRLSKRFRPPSVATQTVPLWLWKMSRIRLCESPLFAFPGWNHSVPSSAVWMMPLGPPSHKAPSVSRNMEEIWLPSPRPVRVLNWMMFRLAVVLVIESPVSVPASKLPSASTFSDQMMLLAMEPEMRESCRYNVVPCSSLRRYSPLSVPARMPSAPSCRDLTDLPFKVSATTRCADRS